MSIRKTAIGTAIVIALLIIFYLLKSTSAIRPSSVVDLFTTLEKQGYTPNIGFSGVYQPGAVIQTQELGVDGHVKVLTTPLLFLTATECFPGKTPMQANYALPESSGNASATLNLGSKLAGKFFPSLAVDSSVVSEYSLKFDNPHTLVFARSELSRQFSKPCLSVFDRELRAGDKLEWFSVIQEVVAVDSLSFELSWKSGTSVDERINALKKVGESLQKSTAKNPKNKPRFDMDMQTAAKESKTTILKINGPVIVAYRSRPLYEVRRNSE